MHTTNWLRTSAAALLVIAAATGQAAVVTANNPSGDLFTNPTPANQFQAVGASGWIYNNVRNSGAIGINGSYARSGNGSAFMAGSVGPGGDSSKADIEYYATGLGALSALSGMSYEWYRSSSSSNEVRQHPSLRVVVDADGDLATTGDRGSLIFERVYNGNDVAAPLDTWVSESVNTTTKLWNTGLGLGFAYNIDATPYPYDSSLADWQAYLPRASILGFSSGFGSGWGPFEGAVDNISWTIAGQTTSTNFEIAAVAVPEPATALLLAMGLLGIVAARRRR